jgi:extracellular elastinolytic metalloproteinase
LRIPQAEEEHQRRSSSRRALGVATLLTGSLLALVPAATAQGPYFNSREATGTVRSVQALDGALTPPAAGDRAAVALGWVRANRARLGMTAADVDDLELTARATSPGTGFTHLRYRRSDRGIPAFDGGLRVSLDRGGRILSVTGSPEAPQVESATPRLGAVAALRALQRDVGVERAVDVESGPDGVRRMTRFEGGDFARLVLFGSGRGTRLAWHLTYRATDIAHYDAVVDAESGAILFRQNLTKGASLADVFPSHPAQGTAVPVDLDGWVHAGANVLSGPYARAYSDLNDNDVISADEEINRTPAGNFRFPFQPFTGATCDPGAQCSWNRSVAGSWQVNRQQNAVQAFYLVNRFRDHLANDPDIRFDGFAGADPVRVETDDGASTGPNAAHLNNASMSTLPEGLPPLMQLYLFDGDGFRTINAGDSAAIVWHEYAHGLSNRLVTHDDGSGALSSAQAGAMGEGWSDWYALDLLVNDGLMSDERPAGEVDLGAYTDSVPHTLRRQGLDCPVGVPTGCPGTEGAGAGGFTYGDFGEIVNGADVHADGEIWAETLWDLRTAVGSDTAQALITEGMRMAPPEPSFLDMRNAILAAETGLPGDHRNAVWTVFARRGMGYWAHTEGAGDVDPDEDFSELDVGVPANRPPTGALAASRTLLGVGGRVDFAASFVDPDSRITRYDWDFDADGAVDRSTAEPATSFAYQRAGTFNASVAARDDRGGSGSATRTITVTRPRPVIKLPHRGRRGKVTVRVRCADRCTVTGRLRVDGGIVRTLRRTVRTTRQRRFELALPRKARRAALRQDRRSVRVRLTVRARYGDGRSTTARRTLRARL